MQVGPDTGQEKAGAAFGPATWAGFAAMCTGMFMAILDIQVVATSLPTIQAALGIAPDQMSWIQTAYLIAEIVAIPLTGFLTRLMGMRLLFAVAITLFTLASIGCAASASFSSLIAWRIVQGFAGGTLIPAVFAAVFLLFPVRRQGIATTLAGVLAVLAPTIGPVVGGWITQTYSWHWLFLINVLPGILSALIALWLLPRAAPRWAEARRLDLAALGLMALGLAALVLGLKEAPERGWASGTVLGLMAVSVVSTLLFVRRSLGSAHPVVELRSFADRNFAIGCALSFVLGIGLFGSVYLMPVFLAFVRGHNALEIGMVMLVTGVAQIVTAPLAVALEQRVAARLLTAAGFALFAAGLAMSAFETAQSDHDAMFWPQLVRGAAIMFCLLPPTRLALGHLEPAQIPDASGVFNLMRNLGGAIGLALIDTVIYSRAPTHAAAILGRLGAGDSPLAAELGVPLVLYEARPAGPIDAATQAMLQPMVEKLALVHAINDAWAMIAVLTLLALGSVALARPSAPARAGASP
jgi:MFS transporter, DHA2 family, multidrug resistance protein